MGKFVTFNFVYWVLFCNDTKLIINRECSSKRSLFSYSRNLQALNIYEIYHRGTNYQQSMAVSYCCRHAACTIHMITIIIDDYHYVYGVVNYDHPMLQIMVSLMIVITIITCL
jgi:hypothetical protein